MSLNIRPATEKDITVILQFIRDLAEYEKLAQDVVATEDKIRQTLFSDRPYAECLIAEWDGKPAAFSLFFYNYSTFLAQPGVYLEDLFVKPEFRQHGIGKAMLKRIAQLAVERGCGRFEWSVLDWNKLAIDFYLKLGAKPMDEWTVYRLNGEALTHLAKT